MLLARRGWWELWGWCLGGWLCRRGRRLRRLLRLRSLLGAKWEGKGKGGIGVIGEVRRDEMGMVIGLKWECFEYITSRLWP